MAQKEGPGFTVAFVSQGSPAAEAGFNLGDKIASVNGLTVMGISFMETVMLRFADAGKTFSFEMGQGGERKIVAADFFR
ncbi:PDZ domain-containing protein [Terracidiphilus gabretensis]|jgi:predicted metalloprotease with PDZ domain|uniref:PDZ domain-containing protein n=1 Tax=Terracidiphilus gabretensis TaxID=1577687 RepID=UPI00071B4C31|nr:PDZ domain-containing protein [Terracidiphilus gabretensis]